MFCLDLFFFAGMRNEKWNDEERARERGGEVV